MVSQTDTREIARKGRARPAIEERALLDPVLAVVTVLHLVAAVGFWDVDAAAFTVVYAGAWLLHHWGRSWRAVGALLILLFGNTLLWSAPAAWVNVGGGAGIVGAALPLALTAVSVLGLASAGAVLLGRRELPARAIVAVSVVLVVAGTAVAALRWSAASPPAAHGEVVAQNTEFVPTRLEVVAGEVTIVLANQDFFWHTVTIPDLDVRIAAPMRATASGTFTASPGTYRFVCEIPGHEGAGMVGTLVVHPTDP